MPQPRKISHLPDEVQDWLREELQARGYSDYDAITEALRERLEREGIEIEISRGAVYRHALAQKKFADLQREADAWAEGFLERRGVEDEAHRHQVLSAMLSTHAFRSMKAAMSPEDEVDDGAMAPRDLHLLGRMLKDLMSSSGIREGLTEKERQRLIAEERQAAADRAIGATRTAGVPLSPEVAAAIKRAVQGDAA